MIARSHTEYETAKRALRHPDWPPRRIHQAHDHAPRSGEEVCRLRCRRDRAFRTREHVLRPAGTVPGAGRVPQPRSTSAMTRTAGPRRMKIAPCCPDGFPGDKKQCSADSSKAALGKPGRPEEQSASGFAPGARRFIPEPKRAKDCAVTDADRRRLIDQGPAARSHQSVFEAAA